MDGFVKPLGEVGADNFEVRYCVGKHFVPIVLSASETNKDGSPLKGGTYVWKVVTFG